MSEAARDRRQPDRLLLFTTVLLCGAGLVMVTSASVAFAYTQHQSAFYYAERQAGWMVIGFAALFVLGRIDYRRVRPLAPAGAVGVALLMLLVLVPHVTAIEGRAVDRALQEAQVAIQAILGAALR